MTRIISPQIASENAIPSPTPRPTATVIPGAALVAAWPEAQTITPGATVTGALRSDGAGQMLDGTVFDLYRFDGQAGQVASLDLHSADFDSVLLLADASGAILAYNDDFSKTSSDSRLVTTLAASGVYQVLVNSYAVEEGAYTLQLTTRDPQETQHTVKVGETAQGWLGPGNPVNATGLYADEWTLTLGTKPLVVWARSAEFDVRLDALDAAGNLLVKNGDMDRIGREFDARILLTPSVQLPPGSEVTLVIALQGEFAVGGAYSLHSTLLPTRFEQQATVLVRPILVTGADGVGGAQATEAQVRAAVVRADEVWQPCGLHIAIENDQVQTLSLAGFEGDVIVQEFDWTDQENTLMSHPTHARPESGVVTVYFVQSIDGGGRYAIAYPTTRYGSTRSGLIIVGDNGVVNPDFSGTLAHELGHLLGLNHPDLDDGDAANDTRGNVMYTTEGLTEDIELDRVYGGVTPLQCVIVRGTRHLLHAPSGVPLVPPELARMDRVLVAGDVVVSALTTRDAISPDAEEQFLDVYYFYGTVGERLTLELRSTAFDPFLILEGPDGGRVSADDDGGGEGNARLSLTLPLTGDYSIGVTSYTRAVGAYTLIVDP